MRHVCENANYFYIFRAISEFGFNIQPNFNSPTNAACVFRTKFVYMNDFVCYLPSTHSVPISHWLLFAFNMSFIFFCGINLVAIRPAIHHAPSAASDSLSVSFRPFLSLWQNPDSVRFRISSVIISIFSLGTVFSEVGGGRIRPQRAHKLKQKSKGATRNGMWIVNKNAHRHRETDEKCLAHLFVFRTITLSEIVISIHLVVRLSFGWWHSLDSFALTKRRLGVMPFERDSVEF